ncbi:DUF421 domain-containing protein [Lysobacter korlensis]|uniref:DUF421 domain-containing protein n=1 Tax=Lysobacter korlensis TaxID=553636 RepID=A0ABV6RXT9_9GAMM
MAERLGITLAEAGAVVLSAIGIYVAFLILVRLLGQRSIARMSTFDVAVVLTLGSAAGRVITGYTPTLTAGIIALVTLFALRWVAHQVGKSRIGAMIVRDEPVLLMAGPEVLTENLRRTRIAVDELREALRVAGVHNRSEVACVVFESTGAVSVVKRGTPLDRELYSGIRGSERIPGELFGP